VSSIWCGQRIERVREIERDGEKYGFMVVPPIFFVGNGEV
jgi:hypothetical protein